MLFSQPSNALVPSTTAVITNSGSVGAIVKTLKIENVPRSQGKELPPQNF